MTNSFTGCHKGDGPQLLTLTKQSLSIGICLLVTFDRSIKNLCLEVNSVGWCSEHKQPVASSGEQYNPS